MGADTKIRRASGSAARAAAVMAFLLLGSCVSVYTSSVTVSPLPAVAAREGSAPRPVDVEDMKRAARIAEEVAGKFGLWEGAPEPDHPLVKRLRGDPECSVLAGYQWASTRPRDGAVALSLAMPKRQSSIEFLIRDVSTPEESTLARDLRDELQRRLEADFPDYPVASKQGVDGATCVP
jgi:hypothetical protein